MHATPLTPCAAHALTKPAACAFEVCVPHTVCVHSFCERVRACVRCVSCRARRAIAELAEVDDVALLEEMCAHVTLP